MTLVVATAALALGSSAAHAVTKCGVRVNPKDGTIEVSASGISGSLQWGEKSGSEPNVFPNAATCVKDGTAKGCQLDAPGTAQSITPPPLCIVFVKDSGVECAAYVKGCTPHAQEGAGVFSMRVNSLVGCGASCFTPPTGSVANFRQNETDVEELSPAARIVARDMAVETSLAAPTDSGGGTRTFTLRVNGADTALQCTEQPGDFTCENTIARVAIPPGSMLSLKVGEAGTIADAIVASVAWRATGGDACASGLCTCPTDRVLCGSSCSDVTSDPRHCGACNHACKTGEDCVSGQCSCPAGSVDCGTACTDVTSDPSNCGACGQACAQGESCVSGQCACPAGVVCGNACTDTTSDPENCGGCGHACPQGSSCVSGQCTACPAGEVVCRRACVDPSSNVDNCGACGQACPAGDVCENGVCVCTACQ